MSNEKKKELFDKALKEALDSGLIKDASKADFDKSHEFYGRYRLVSKEDKILAHISMHKIRLKKSNISPSGCFLSLFFGIFLSNPILGLALLAIPTTIVIPSLMSAACEGKKTGETVKILFFETSCPEVKINE